MSQSLRSLVDALVKVLRGCDATEERSTSAESQNEESSSVQLRVVAKERPSTALSHNRAIDFVEGRVDDLDRESRSDATRECGRKSSVGGVVFLRSNSTAGAEESCEPIVRVLSNR